MLPEVRFRTVFLIVSNQEVLDCGLDQLDAEYSCDKVQWWDMHEGEQSSFDEYAQFAEMIYSADIVIIIAVS